MLFRDTERESVCVCVFACICWFVVHTCICAIYTYMNACMCAQHRSTAEQDSGLRYWVLSSSREVSRGFQSLQLHGLVHTLWSGVSELG